jgi:hypothetical protein
MKTKSLLNKYCKLTAGLLGAKPSDIHIQRYMNKLDPDNLKVIGQEWRDIGSEEEIGKDFKCQYGDWQVGYYRVVTKDGKEISKWKLYQLPHCCGVMVSCDVVVMPEFRNKRVGTLLNNLRQDIGRILRYSCVLCTDIDQNEHQKRILETNGWKTIHKFINIKTKNKVNINVINI